jgi:DNA-binding YbaB/EbfC family protein
MGTGFAKKKKQAKLIQDQIARMQSAMQNTEVTGTAGSGLVTIVLDGQHQIKSLKIKPECVDKDDVEGLEVLIKAAFSDAEKKLAESQSKNMPNLNQNLFG